jgi:pyruvate/2-oxoglutarate/acetoin dehydrogenase E1 component
MSNTIIESLRLGLTGELDSDDRVFLMGEDVGIGGSFHLTLGLTEKYGPGRIRDTPVSEAGFVGLAIGAAMAGMRPIVDFQYGDFLLPAADQIIQQACKLRHMSGGQVRVPIVLHTPTGASGRGAQHANSVENYFYGIPGLILGAPATAWDAKGMITTAIRCDDPVLLVSHKYLYGSGGRDFHGGDGVVADVPVDPYEVPVGTASVRREGQHLTIASALLMVHRALNAAQVLAADGVEAEVLDMRWLAPLDSETVVRSVQKTGALLVVEEGPGRGGWGGAVAAAVADRAIGSLDAPIRRLTGPDTPLPFAPHLEQQLVPSAERIVAEAQDLLGSR